MREDEDEDEEFPVARTLVEPEAFDLTPRRSFIEPDLLVDSEGKRRREEEGIGERERREFIERSGERDRTRDSAPTRVARSYISTTSSVETIPAGKSNNERIFVEASCCLSNCFFSSYVAVLDLFEDSSDDEVEDARASFEKLALDDDRPTKFGNTLFWGLLDA